MSRSKKVPVCAGYMLVNTASRMSRPFSFTR